MNPIYSKYKERFIEISGGSKSLFLKSILKKYSYDLGSVLELRGDSDEFYDFLWRRRTSLTVMDGKTAAKAAKAAGDITAEKLLNREIKSLNYLKREVEEREKESGQYDLFVGCPFVTGVLDGAPLRAPLILFPVRLSIEKDVATITASADPIMLNKAFVLAYAADHAIKTDGITQEFDVQNGFQEPNDIVEHLNSKGFKIKSTKRKTFMSFDPSPIATEGTEIKNYAVLGRFPVANSIYNDYIAMEKDNLTAPAIEALLNTKEAKKRAKKKSRRSEKKAESGANSSYYPINELDFTQENALREIARHDNIVIYGPPGTGKSQTIVNIISDALCKKKRVLVVSQKRAALDVVYSRLGKLNKKCMLIPDPEKSKAKFLENVRAMHARTVTSNSAENRKAYQKVEFNIKKEIETLENISTVLFEKTSFGLTLQEQYAASYNIGKDSKDYKLYGTLLGTPIMSKSYTELSEDLNYIESMGLDTAYLTHIDMVRDNEMIVHIAGDADLHSIKEALSFIENLLGSDIVPFDVSKYPHSRYLTTFYLENSVSGRSSLKKIAGIVADAEHPALRSILNVSAFPLFWLIFPFAFFKRKTIKENVMIDLNVAMRALADREVTYRPLRKVLDAEGYAMAVGGLLNGNTVLLKKLYKALENYIPIRDLNKSLAGLSPSVKELLTFAYTQSDGTAASVKATLGKIIPLRIYHEIVGNNAYIEPFLSKTVSFEDIRHHILQLKNKQCELSKLLAADKFTEDYSAYFASSENSKDYLYEIQKQRGVKTIRQMMELFHDYLLRLFPCWLLSPEGVSTILPLKRGLFDLVVFDEASQMFIESALPAIYRGDKVVIAGDNKQLRPTAGFVKRIMGCEFDPDADLSTQAALEVESLLDLAAARYYPVHLSYHYRSKSAELIDFSNAAFYENKLQIAPNTVKTLSSQPIERIKVKGEWAERHNVEEASAVVKLVKKLFSEREAGETIGIVTFNIEQKELIDDMLDAEAEKNAAFRKQLFSERNRFTDGEFNGLFVKNLENVQGDERDIIIFSIGYAKNGLDKVAAHFGSLSTEGGENRLNVAITRAKEKVYVITSIEPEELDRAEVSKNNGPKLLKKYLQYARAVSNGSRMEASEILSTMHPSNEKNSSVGAYENQIKTELEKLGYSVDINLGNTDYKLSLGVYDRGLDRYILGIECDYRAFNSSPSVLERDVYRIKYLESRGWKIMRIWSRDWWLSREKVLDSIVKEIEKQRSLLAAV